jgi:hypothetical protein
VDLLARTLTAALLAVILIALAATSADAKHTRGTHVPQVNGHFTPLWGGEMPVRPRGQLSPSSFEYSSR